MDRHPPTRREHRRPEMTAGIIAAAREMLTAGGMNAITLRAIAGQVGVSPAAIYRYFPSLDALIRALHDDVVAELRTAMIYAREESAHENSATRLQEVARAFRKWALGHPAELRFSLGLDDGNTLPSMFLSELSRSWHTPVNAAFLSAWVKLYGLVLLESSGSRRWMPGDTDIIFDATLDEFDEQLPWEYRWAGCASPSTMDA